ncbi:MAG: DUF2589 domain-containing protein, partial [Anaerolineaceae bacterium]|nr:DUF2589 domain-containing protein [Anaerolineaceae bacterium]
MSFLPKIPNSMVPPLPDFPGSDLIPSSSGGSGSSGSNPPIPTPGVPPLPDFPNSSIIPNPGKELSSLNFASIIGGPLRAAIHAQAQAAQTTVDFIKKVGFRNPPPQVIAKKGAAGEDPGVMEPEYVAFKYPKEIMPYQPAVFPGLIGIDIVKPGKGYTTAPQLTLPPEIVGARISAETDGDKVTRIVIQEAGTGWKKGATITVAAPSTDGNRETAELLVHVREYQEAKPAQYETMTLLVPILTMMPIPYLRIEEMNLEFDVKIDQTETVDVSTTVGM